MQPRWVAVAAAPLIVALGLGARAVLHGLAAKIAGDALYTVLVYDLVIVVRPAIRPVRAALVALGISFAVEIAQLTPYPAWLSSKHVLLRLIFGTTFGFVDLGGYVVGAVVVVAADTVARRVVAGRPSP